MKINSSRRFYTFFTVILISISTLEYFNLAEAQSGLQFNGTSQYVTSGVTVYNSPLNTPTFTVETWFRRDGTGIGVTTGSGGITLAVPLIAKGTSESETAPADINYFLGINTTGNVICADFEEAQSGTSPSLNHPISGTTPIVNGTWYHAAATYNGSKWQLFLNGNLEAELIVGQPANAAVISPFSMGTSIRSNGSTIQGYFNGAIDEVRLWNYARTQSEVQQTINSEISSAQTGLLGRWGLNEGSGTSAVNTIVGSPAGTLINTPLWVTGAPFNITFTPPNAPSNLLVTPISNSVLQLTWTDNASNETGFEIERSTTGSGGPFTALGTVAANTISYYSTGLALLTNYCYRVRATNNSGQSAYATPACGTTLADANNALDFGSSNAYVTFGNPASLKLTQFTIETWFRRDGTGVATTTGTGGIALAVPLLAKGTADAEVPARDINYLLGINTAGNFLCADLEENPSGLNHPITGVTPIVQGAWYHAAVTYDGTKWQLFLNGILENESVIGVTPANASDCPVSLATSIKLDNTPLGFFDGVMDEVRIWNYARTATEIRSTINSQITATQIGLLARWGLNEEAGTSVSGSAGTTITGTITGTGSGWVTGAPFNIMYIPPVPPSNLTVTPVSNSSLMLTWTDNSSNETGFEIEKSTSGPEGPFIPDGTVTANVITYSGNGLTPLTNYCFRVRAVNGSLQSEYTIPACGTTTNNDNSALDFGGTNAFVQVDNDAALQLPQFTIETWFRRDGIGIITPSGSGTGGITNPVPLITKGTSEAEISTVDINYFLCINNDGNTIAFDFEEGASGPSPSLNHPLSGTTVISNGIWYHVAVTYDGTTVKLYLNGNLDASQNFGVPVAAANTGKLSIATSLTSTGTTKGFFDGVMDEIRIWNLARTQSEIQSNINNQISSSQTGLVARWGLIEGTGTTVSSTAGITLNGTVAGSNYQWVGGAPFNLNNLAPDIPVLIGPADGATEVSTIPTLDVSVSDPDGDNLTVNFYGRPAVSTAATFSIIVLPDAQNYTSGVSGGLPATFTAQTQWCVTNQSSRNIQYVSMVGDITNDNSTTAWANGNTAMSKLDAVAPGIPYGIVLGNHDYTGSTTLYNNYFPASRFEGRPYYGGHYGLNNDNHYDFFNSDGMEFIVINLSSSDQNPATAVLDWADALLKTYSTKRAILVNHYVTETGNPANFSAPGQTTYNALKNNPNLFLMLCGHVPGVGRRSDTYNGSTVTSLLADYQSEANGGNGWLRIMEFDPPNNMIHVTTYSPTLNQWKTDAGNQFDIPYVMVPNTFQMIGTNTGVVSGSNTSKSWAGLEPSTEYEWYVTVSDGITTTTSSTWSFTTTALATYNLTVTNNGQGSVTLNPSGGTYTTGTTVTLTPVPDAGYEFSSWSGIDAGNVINTNGIYTILMDGNKSLTSNFSRLSVITLISPNGSEEWHIGSTHNITWTSAGMTGNIHIEYTINNGTNWTDIVASTSNSGSYSWLVPDMPSINCLVRVSKTDGNPFDVSNSVFTISVDPDRHFVPVWTGNGFDHMNFYTLTATLDGVNLQPGDEIGIFDGTYCVGSGKLTQVLDGTNYLEIRVSSDDPSTIDIVEGYVAGHSAIFKLWDATGQSEFPANEITYESGSNVFSVGGSTWYHIGGVSMVNQEIPLTTGWNIMSFAVQPTNMSMLSIVTPLITEGTLTKVQDERGDAIEQLPAPIGWVDNIGPMNVSEGYKIKVTGNTTMSVTGQPVTLPHDNALDAGWNIMGYPSMSSQGALAAFNPLITAATLLKVQDEAGNAIEKLPDPIGWIDYIINLTSGHGYKVKTTANTTLTINSSGKGEYQNVEGTTITHPIHFKPAYTGNGLDQMNIYIKKPTVGGVGLKTGDEIGVFDGGLCVGTVVVNDPNLEYYMVVASLDDPTTKWADGFTEGNNFELRLWDNQAGLERKVQQMETEKGYNKTFEKFGTSVLAVDFETVVNTSLGDAFPNPSTDKTTFTFQLGKESKVRMEIYNIEGDLIKVLVDRNMAGGTHQIEWDNRSTEGIRVSTGVYFYRLKLDNYLKIKQLVIH